MKLKKKLKKYIIKLIEDPQTSKNFNDSMDEFIQECLRQQKDYIKQNTGKKIKNNDLINDKGQIDIKKFNAFFNKKNTI